MTEITPIPPPVTVPYVATCHTSGCGNENVPIDLELIEGTQVTCGPCGEPITDLVAKAESKPTTEGNT